jgi:hypothetical protein
MIVLPKLCPAVVVVILFLIVKQYI